MGHTCDTAPMPARRWTPRALRPHIVLLDIGLHSTWTAIRWRGCCAVIRHGVVLVAITAYGGTKTVRTRRRASTHVTKPIDVKLLESIVTTAHH